MRNAMRFFRSLLVALIVALGVGTAFGAGAGAAVLGLSAMVKVPAGTLGMGVVPEIWTDYIVGNIFKNNEFLLESVDESQYVLQGSVVHIPQAGAPSAVKRNRASLPASISRRVDVDITYALDEFTTDPRFIPDADTIQLSYDKLESCMTEDMANLRQVIADTLLYNWRPKYYIKATKTKSADYLIHGTGVRTGVCVEDFVKAKEIFNKWGMPKEDRYVILNSEMYAQICNDVRLNANDNLLTAVYDPLNGNLVKLEGWKIIERATVLMASNSSLTAVSGKPYFGWTSDTDLTYTPEDYEAIEAGTTAADNTACCSALFWQKTAVCRAMGQTKMFDNVDDPTYYGTIYSFLNRMGGRLRRQDHKGVLGLIQVYSAS